MTVSADFMARRTKNNKDDMKYIRPLVRSILENWTKHSWSIQGFGMLRTYLEKELRLHVWDSRFAVPNVTDIHDHPWHFESRVVVGRISNTRYRMSPCMHFGPGLGHVKTQIVCGQAGGNVPAVMKSRGEHVWLIPQGPEIYEAGAIYRQEASEVHRTSYEDGTVTLVSREFMPDTEHAHVFFKADDDWVSAEPREAKPFEVSTIIERALNKF